MRVLYYDCFCGISGDMNLGALIDLGVNKDYIISELSKLNLSSEYEIKVYKKIKNGITGTKVDVILKNQPHHEHTHDHHKDEESTVNHHFNHNEHGVELSNNYEEELHHYNHGEEGHFHEQIDNHGHGEDLDSELHQEKSHHHHRNLKDIEDIINKSDLNENIKKTSLNMFMKVAEAEAKVHGKPLYEVHFHEVGATDSIVDIVGAAIAIDYLKVDKIMASTVQVGGGFVKCAHGVMPVPAPATVNILKDIPINTGIVSFETTTPTGAAILAANVKEFTNKIEFSVEKTGYGLGTKEFHIPNVLRVYMGTIESGEEVEQQYILETNIDDMNPELYGYIEEKLFQAGALDVFKTPIIMKKGRPAIKLSILVNSKAEKQVLDVVFMETTSIGIRKFKVEKIMLNREFRKVETKYGQVTVKISYYDGKAVKYKAEYEDCRRLAEENNVPIREIYREIHIIYASGM